MSSVIEVASYRMTMGIVKGRGEVGDPRDGRARLLRGALELLGERGYGETDLRQAAARGDAPRGSIYHHFPGGKADLAGRRSTGAPLGWRSSSSAHSPSRAFFPRSTCSRSPCRVPRTASLPGSAARSRRSRWRRPRRPVFTPRRRRRSLVSSGSSATRSSARASTRRRPRRSPRWPWPRPRGH